MQLDKDHKWNMNNFFLKMSLVYFVMLITGFMGDMIFPPWKMGDTWFFHGSHTMGFTLANLALLFAGMVLIIGLTAIGYRRMGSLNETLLLRQIMTGLFFSILSISFFLGSIYILSKKITVDNDRLTYFSLLERKVVLWSDVNSFRGNFVAGSKLGFGRGEYGWFEFITREGETIDFSLRFMQGVNRLESVIQQRLAQ
jgi:hypothetical protein